MGKIFLYTYAHCNLGDDLFIKTICDRYPTTKFYMECSPEFSEPFEGIDNLHIIKKNLFYRIGNKLLSLGLRTVKQCDATIILGGSMFIQGANNNWQKKLLLLREIQKNSKQFFVIGANFGPYQSENFRDSYYNFFKRMDDVCFRDQKSVGMFEKLNNIRLGSDVVFDLKFPSTIKKNKLTVIPISLNNRGKLAGFEKKYISELVNIIVEADRKNMSVTLHSFCMDQGDEKAIQQILSQLNPKLTKKISVVNYRGNIKESLQSLSESSLIVTTRFHGMVLGWLGHSKVFPIRYDIKMDNLLSDLQLSGIGYNIENIADLNIDSVFKEGSVNVSMEDIRSLYDSPFEALDKFLK